MEKVEDPIDPNSEMNCEADDLLPTERIGLVAWALAIGETLTTQQIAERTGLTYGGAWALMQKLSRVLPIGFNDTTFIEGYWFAFDKHPYKATLIEK